MSGRTADMRSFGPGYLPVDQGDVTAQRHVACSEHEQGPQSTPRLDHRTDTPLSANRQEIVPRVYQNFYVQDGQILALGQRSGDMSTVLPGDMHR